MVCTHKQLYKCTSVQLCNCTTVKLYSCTVVVHKWVMICKVIFTVICFPEELGATRFRYLCKSYFHEFLVNPTFLWVHCAFSKCAKFCQRFVQKCSGQNRKDEGGKLRNFEVWEICIGWIWIKQLYSIIHDILHIHCQFMIHKHGCIV